MHSACHSLLLPLHLHTKQRQPGLLAASEGSSEDVLGAGMGARPSHNAAALWGLASVQESSPGGPRLWVERWSDAEPVVSENSAVGTGGLAGGAERLSRCFVCTEHRAARQGSTGELKGSGPLSGLGCCRDMCPTCQGALPHSRCGCDRVSLVPALAGRACVKLP